MGGGSSVFVAMGVWRVPYFSFLDPSTVVSPLSFDLFCCIPGIRHMLYIL